MSPKSKHPHQTLDGSRRLKVQTPTFLQDEETAVSSKTKQSQDIKSSVPPSSQEKSKNQQAGTLAKKSDAKMNLPKAQVKTSSSQSHTPMLQHYLDLKQEHPNALLLYRMGDFYEMFFDDAVKGAQLLDLTLTSRGTSAGQPVPMAGVPFRSVDQYLKRLIEQGIHVAVCEQVGEPTEGKTLMERKLTRVLTPGTLTEESLIEEDRDYLVVAICTLQSKTGQPLWGIAWLDLAGGNMSVMELNDKAQLQEHLTRRPIAEILIANDSEELPLLPIIELPTPTHRPVWEFDVADGLERLQRQFDKRQIDYLGIDGLSAAVGAAGALLCYASETHRSDLPSIQNLQVEQSDTYVRLDPIAHSSLELDQPMSGRPEDRNTTLYYLLNDCATPMGKRTLRRWIHSPLRNPKKIADRLDAIELLMAKDPSGILKKNLAGVGDLERSFNRIVSSDTPPPRDLDRVRSALRCLNDFLTTGKDLEPLIQPVIDIQAELREILQFLEHALADPIRAQLSDGGIIRQGFDVELDELRSISTNATEKVVEMQERERQKTGISQLKISYNRVHGYYLEVPRSVASSLPPEYVATQTLKNSQRFTNNSLRELQEKVLGGTARALARERVIYNEIVARIRREDTNIMTYCTCIQHTDVLASLARVSRQQGYTKPQITTDSVLIIEDGFHPVIKSLAGQFTANSIRIDSERRLLLITGPNMGGKSTYMRQTALIALMAHIGCYVPARHAIVGLIDAIMTRIGASDRLAHGLSTFMVEMTETATILANATPQTLIVMDEIGRGTSTADGLALVKAITQHLAQHTGAMTLLATHYLEMTELVETLNRAVNLSLDAREYPNGEIRFLHEVKEGGASNSYGLVVARLAGIPSSILEAANRHLTAVPEKSAFTPDIVADNPTVYSSEGEHKAWRQIAEQLQELDTDEMSPKEAHAVLENLVALYRKQTDKPS